MSRASWITVVFCLLFAVGAVLVHNAFREAQERPAAQRLLSEARLREFAQALATYRAAHGGAWPANLFELMKSAHMPFGAQAVRGAGVYRYVQPSAGAVDSVLVMAADGVHVGAQAGEPWGAEGEITPVVVPSVAYVLTVGLRIEALVPEERDRRWREAQRLSPGASGSTAVPAVP
jgi:hypothetical protein